MELTEKTNSQKRVFTGRLIHVRHDEVTLPDGTETIREVVEHPGGVAILAMDGENRVLMEEHCFSSINSAMPSSGSCAKYRQGNENLVRIR